VDYVFGLGVKMVEATSYNAKRDDDVHGRLYVIEMKSTLKEEWLVSPRDVLFIGILTQEGFLSA